MIDKDILLVAEDAAEKLSGPDWVAVDCRFDLGAPDAGRAMYEEGHLPGAVFLDLDRDLAGPVTAHSGRHPLPDAATLATRLGQLGLANRHRFLVYDADSGALAARAWWILRWLGHDAVYLLDGGYRRWRSLGYPVEVEPVTRPATEFTARPRNELVVTTEELAGDLDAIPAARLVDARDGARFRGELEPIDPVAGHIPGARNAPVADFVRADGTWRALDERRHRLLEALDGEPDAAWSVMCGSGVTACHLAISAIEAGLSEPRVYVGSWSEWIRDPERPIGVDTDSPGTPPGGADLA